MRKIISIALVLLIFVPTIAGCGKETENVTRSNSSKEDSVKSEEFATNQPEETPSQTIKDATEGPGGGNEFENNGESGALSTNNVERISVLVSKDGYFYENKPIELDEFIAIISECEKDDITIEISDDDATYRAYQRLIDELDELEILYIEE